MPFLTDISVLNTNAIPASKLPYLWMVQGEFQSVVILLRYSVCLFLRGPTRRGATEFCLPLGQGFLMASVHQSAGNGHVGAVALPRLMLLSLGCAPSH